MILRNKLSLLGVFALVAVAVLWLLGVDPVGVSEVPVVCTEEAKICPDGSAVRRVGPNCEFAKCPSEEEASGEDEGILPYNSGVEGAVLLGPTCPVMRDPPDPVCADKPYATAVLVYRTGSKTPFLIGNSDAEGRFRLSLPPGSYTLSARSNEPFPSCSGTSIAVVPGEYASLTLSCDTGIR